MLKTSVCLQVVTRISSKNRVNSNSNKAGQIGVKVITGKTKCMKNNTKTNQPVILNQDEIKEVDLFSYLFFVLLYGSEC